MVTIDRNRPDDDAIGDAARVIERGGVVIVPTDTVYGLAAHPGQAEALSRVYRLKQRPEGMPLALIVGGVEEIWPLVRDVTPAVERMVREHLPGPVTFVLRRAADGPPWAMAVAPGRETIAVRFPACEVAGRLARRVGPYAATSANPTGERAPAVVAEIPRGILEGSALALDAGPCPIGRPSAVVDLTGPSPVVIRPGPGWDP
jgi:tRNA threonylcarbamoyl adenosine modification protein (Sua5/YciO/YrdC/YwlC family)